MRVQSSGEFPEFGGENFLEISELMGQDPWDCYFDIMAAAGRGLNSLIMIGRLFTEQHMAEMITHPLFNLAVDIWSTRIDGPLSERTRHPLYFSGHITYLTHYVRELGLAASGGRHPQNDEHAGDALRSARSWADPEEARSRISWSWTTTRSAVDRQSTTLWRTRAASSTCSSTGWRW